MADDQLCADPRVVKAWITGWALARETAPPVPDSGGFRVDVGWPRQRVRYVFPSLDEGMRRVAERVSEPWILLKVCAPPDAVRACLPPRWLIERLGFMMTRDASAPSDRAARVDGYTLEVDAAGPVAIATILDARGDVAAGGRLAQVGEFAIYDRIQTHPEHWRRLPAPVRRSAACSSPRRRAGRCTRRSAGGCTRSTPRPRSPPSPLNDGGAAPAPGRASFPRTPKSS
jgi:hypothetical protein